MHRHLEVALAMALVHQIVVSPVDSILFHTVSSKLVSTLVIAMVSGGPET